MIKLQRLNVVKYVATEAQAKVLIDKGYVEITEEKQQPKSKVKSEQNSQ